MLNETIWSREYQTAVLSFVRNVIAAEFAGSPDPAMPELACLRAQGACFVTLNDAAGNLRGCIGNLQAYEPLGDNLRHNALNAAFRDPRFPPLEPEELPETHIEVSILSAPSPIAGPEEFIIGRHGIILQQSGRSAVFLPQVAPEQGWDRETTLDFLARKAGFQSNAWKSKDAAFSVFKTAIFR